MSQWLASQTHNLSRWLDRRATLLETQGSPPVAAGPIPAAPALGPAPEPEGAPRAGASPPPKPATPAAAPQVAPRTARGPVPSYPVASVLIPAAPVWRASVSTSTFASQAPPAASVGAPFQPALATSAPHVFHRWPTQESPAVSTTVNEYP